MIQKMPSVGRKSPRKNVGAASLIPMEFAPLLDEFALDAYHRIELWSFALVLLMIDEEQVRQVGSHEVAGTEWVILQTRDGEQFEIVKPQLDEESEHRLLFGVREIVEEARQREQRAQ